MLCTARPPRTSTDAIPRCVSSSSTGAGAAGLGRPAARRRHRSDGARSRSRLLRDQWLGPELRDVQRAHLSHPMGHALLRTSVRAVGRRWRRHLAPARQAQARARVVFAHAGGMARLDRRDGDLVLLVLPDREPLGDRCDVGDRLVDDRARGTHLPAGVGDDGLGGADPTGSGLRGIADRTEAAGGRFRVHSSSAGTTIEAELPCGS